MNLKKLFKRTSYIEILIIITIAFVTIFLVKFFGQKKDFLTIKVEVVKKNWVNNYDPYGYRTPFWLSDKIKIGQTEKDKAGNVIATITDIENYEKGEEEAELYLTLRIESRLDKRSGIYYYKNQPLNLGSSIELVLNNIEVYGQIIDNNVPKDGYPTKYFNVQARGRNLDSWIYSKIKPGLKIYNRANKDIIGEIIAVNLEESTLQEIKTDSTGRFLKVAPGKNKDLIVNIKLKAYLMDSKWFFSGHQDLKIGNSLYLYTNQINLYQLEIQELEELNQ